LRLNQVSYRGFLYVSPDDVSPNGDAAGYN